MPRGRPADALGPPFDVHLFAAHYGDVPSPPLGHQGRVEHGLGENVAVLKGLQHDRLEAIAQARVHFAERLRPSAPRARGPPGR